MARASSTRIHGVRLKHSRARMDGWNAKKLLQQRYLPYPKDK